MVDGACGQVIHNDDTTMKILSLLNEAQGSERKGMFTTGMVSILNDQKIGLFFTGRQHAGENLGGFACNAPSGSGSAHTGVRRTGEKFAQEF